MATPLNVTLTLPPPPYARKGGEVLAAQLAKVGINAKIENVEWAQWLSGTFKGNFDLTVINHVEPLDYLIYTDPGYYFGYDSQAYRDLAQAEAVADLIDASTEAAARSASRSLSGAFSAEIHTLRDALIHLRMLVEATLDFPEEEIDFLQKADAQGQLQRLTEALAGVMRRARQPRRH